ncbi:MAG TPA: PH domain-containing protein [Candidatus Acidoferrum sp.]|nr:PH domain-containing protein [Candidatus Acidoferrum sp.]
MEFKSEALGEMEMGYVDRNLVPGEILQYRTRHHWLVLLGPVFAGLVLLVPGVALLVEAIAARDSAGLVVGNSTISPKMMAIAGAILLAAAIITISYGVAKRNATEMAVTNRRVLIKTGMTSRRTLDLMLSRVESIGVEETAAGRMLGYGSVIVRGTGGTPEPFLMIAHPQEFRRAVQEQIGAPQAPTS